MCDFCVSQCWKNADARLPDYPPIHQLRDGVKGIQNTWGKFAIDSVFETPEQLKPFMCFAERLRNNVLAISSTSIIFPIKGSSKINFPAPYAINLQPTTLSNQAHKHNKLTRL